MYENLVYEPAKRLMCYSQSMGIVGVTMSYSLYLAELFGMWYMSVDKEEESQRRHILLTWPARISVVCVKWYNDS